MLFLNIVSVQFNTVFPALNKSREACSIEMFVGRPLSTRNFRTCCCTASLFSNLIPPLSDSFSGPNKWQSLGTRFGLYSRLCISEPPNPSRQFPAWFDEPYEGTQDPAERLHLVEAHQLCWNPSGRHFTEFEMFTNNLPSRNHTQAQFSCSLMHLSSRTPLMLSAVIAVYAARQCEHHHRPTDGRRKKEQTTQMHVT